MRLGGYDDITIQRKGRMMMDHQQNKQSEALFEQLNKNKKKKKRKTLRTVITVILVIAVALVLVFNYLRKQVDEQFASMAEDVLTYEAKRGQISTVVTGSGTLSEVGLEEISVPAGVEIVEVLPEAGDAVTAGQVLATVNMATVLDAMEAIQSELNSLDSKINTAMKDSVAGYITAGVEGRIKKLYAEAGTDIAACMTEHGAVALLSLDGYMAVDIAADALEADDEVVVILADGTEVDGTVEKVVGGIATVLISDDGPKPEEAVKVMAEDTEVGSGKLYIHSPLKVTGYAGTVTELYREENDWVDDYYWLYELEDTAVSVNYDSLLRNRADKEAELMELLAIYRDGAILSPMDGQISSVEYKEGSIGKSKTDLLTIYPNTTMQITITIDEMDILSLEVGQTAEIIVESISEETVYDGVVTEIDTGTDTYKAVVELPKADGMLPGMTADVDVQIQGVEDAIIIPVDALHRTSSIYYVYTSYDSETLQYGGRKDVTIGMQNSNFVEIISGLSEGDTVYYVEKAETSWDSWMPGGMPGGMAGGWGG